LALIPLGVVAYWLWISGFLFDWGGIKIEWIPGPRYLVFAGRVMALDMFPIEQVALNELYSKLLNQSFSTTALALLCSVIAMTYPLGLALKEPSASEASGVLKRHSAKTVGAQPVVIGALLILTMLILSQLFLPPGYEYALPNNDAGNSRFSLPFTLSVLPATLIVFHALSQNRRDVKDQA
jgi:hypothetical protein